MANWYDVFGDDTIADAVLDRVVHSAHRIELKGESNSANIQETDGKGLTLFLVAPIALKPESCRRISNVKYKME